MNRTLRNVDDAAWQALLARAAAERRAVSDLINEAIRAYLARPAIKLDAPTLRRLEPESYPPGNERLSAGIDAVVYGSSR